MISDDLYKKQADICKSLGHYLRIKIIDLLDDKEMIYSELAEKTAVPKSSLSQHLSAMASNGIIIQRKEGKKTYCRLSTPKVAQACRLMREVLIENLQENYKLLNQIEDQR